jgi:small subunit ribosomal protein S1
MSDRPAVRRRSLRPEAPAEAAAPEAGAAEVAAPTEPAPSPMPAPAVHAAAPAVAPEGPAASALPVGPPASRSSARNTKPEARTSDRLAELEALVSGGFDMASLLDGASSRGPARGTKVSGPIVLVGKDELHIDLGGRATGFLSRRDKPEAQVGDVITAWVVRSDDLGVQLGIKLGGDAAADLLADAAEAGVPVEGTVTSRNAGGYEVRVGGVRGFCPLSQISRVPLADPDSVLGQTLSFLVLETEGKVVVSRRKLEDRDAATTREGFWAEAAVGQRRTAVVTHVTAHRAFLDIDGADAMLPRREVGWEDIADLTTRLARGQRIDVRLVDLDRDNQKILVSCKDPDMDPWRRLPEEVAAGDVRTCRVLGHAPFGAFLELLPGLSGLLHSSRLAGQPLPEPGASVAVKVHRIDVGARRVELAMPEWVPSSTDAAVSEGPAPLTVGAEVDGVVERVDRGGVRVRLSDGRYGFLPEREVDLAAGQMLAHRFRAGFPVKARIADEQGGRITLSQRADDREQQNAWRTVAAEASKASMGTLGDLLSRALQKR